MGLIITSPVLWTVSDGCSVFCDLSTDPTLFEGHGDYQFDIYRHMKEENGWVELVIGFLIFPVLRSWHKI